MRKLALPIALMFGFAMIGCSDDDSCVDMDGDGYGQGSGCLGEDCDDNDESVWMTMVGYADADEDGENAINPTENLCTDGTLPAGFFETAGTDCDDTDASAVEMVQAYVDADGDGYGEAGSDLLDVCGAVGYLPPGYADNDDDCDDASEVLFMEWTGYPDMDGDTVATDTEITVCATAVTPPYLMTDPGTDCDDLDPMATNDASQPAMCATKGFCVDSEPLMGIGAPDMAGIGACSMVDCNGQDPTCNPEPISDTGNACVDGGDCNTGEICVDPTGGANLTCWTIPACCNNNPAGYNCYDLAMNCLNDCAELTDDAARIACMQFQCFEQATPVAQYLYGIAQTCAAAAGCFAEEDFIGCAMSQCNAEFVQGCLADNS